MTPPPEQSDSEGEERWEIHGRFVIDADSEEWADAALRGLERAGQRAPASVTIHIHASESRS